jgi:hypothetical protein
MLFNTSPSRARRFKLWPNHGRSALSRYPHRESRIAQNHHQYGSGYVKSLARDAAAALLTTRSGGKPSLDLDVPVPASRNAKEGEQGQRKQGRKQDRARVAGGQNMGPLRSEEERRPCTAAYLTIKSVRPRQSCWRSITEAMRRPNWRPHCF